MPSLLPSPSCGMSSPLPSPSSGMAPCPPIPPNPSFGMPVAGMAVAGETGAAPGVPASSSSSLLSADSACCARAFALCGRALRSVLRSVLRCAAGAAVPVAAVAVVVVAAAAAVVVAAAAAVAAIGVVRVESPGLTATSAGLASVGLPHGCAKRAAERGSGTPTGRAGSAPVLELPPPAPQSSSKKGVCRTEAEACSLASSSSS
mmetsp:Transcript_37323/g.86274  ORF Transcript_37323/g.86274 Transcript_37323/m.86274 type:complete len:204 (+) Transcript_37323:1367-1978(+)